MRHVKLTLISLLTVNPAMSKPILQGSQGSYVVTEFVATTPQRAWGVLSKFESQAEWAPDIIESKIIKRNGNRIELQQTYRAGYTFGLPIQAKIKITENPPKRFSYKLIQGERLNTLQGSWTITKVSGGIELKHEMEVDPQVPSLLRPFYYAQQEQNLLSWLTILKSRMELYSRDQ